jgi:hypothetical protein
MLEITSVAQDICCICDMPIGSLGLVVWSPWPEAFNGGSLVLRCWDYAVATARINRVFLASQPDVAKTRVMLLRDGTRLMYHRDKGAV